MKILVINSGSSSIKYQLFDLEEKAVLASGLLERIGEGTGKLTNKTSSADGMKSHVEDVGDVDHQAGLRKIIAMLCSPKGGAIKDPAEIRAIGHRVVHGGDVFHEPVLVDDDVLKAINKFSSLAPLHNPANLKGIEVARELCPKVPQVAVFDTAFHQTMPPEAYNYAVPRDWCESLHVRRYGFHGTSHQYVSRLAADYLGLKPDQTNLIVLHLGNGASVTAVRNGCSVDTSMGLTPLEGLIMGTRSGDIDPAIPFYVARQSGIALEETEKLLNKQSGLKGICGKNDMREIQQAAGGGDKNAGLALDMYCYRIRKYIGAYMAVLGRLDALVFTAGIGENSSLIRSKACATLSCMGIELDETENSSGKSGIRAIQTAASTVKILVVPTNEELEIAEQTLRLVKGGG